MCASRPSSSSPRSDDRTPDPRRVLGAQGETIACEHMERLGFAILDRNIRTRHGEIDAIAFDGATLVFVEVKTRRARRAAGAPERQAGPFGPLDGLRVAQRTRLRRLAAAWLQGRPVSVGAKEIRFDAIGVLLDGADRLVSLDHLEGAW